MNLEIMDKFNNFVKNIENKEKHIWLTQINQNEKYNPQNKSHKSIDDCSCGISSGYDTYVNDKNSELKNRVFIKDDDLSLLDDDCFIDKKNKENKENNLLSSEKSIKSEFENIFLIDDYNNNIKKSNENESSIIKNKLEHIYNKTIAKKNNIKQNNNNNKLSKYDIKNYIDGEKINEKNMDLKIKKLSELIDYVYDESIKGWNKEQNLYILNIDKLKENLQKIIFTNISNQIKIGFIYRDYNEPKIYVDKDFTKYWIGYNVSSDSKNNELIYTKYNMNDKILFYCLKNLSKSNKFKKKISKWNYKFIKKTIQIYGNKKLTIDVILFIGIKNIE